MATTIINWCGRRSYGGGRPDGNLRARPLAVPRSDDQDQSEQQRGQRVVGGRAEEVALTEAGTSGRGRLALPRSDD